MTNQHDANSVSVFQHGGFAVLRMATLPADAASTDPPGLDDEAALAGYLRQLANDPVLSEAIEVSSRSLADTLARIRAGRSVSTKKLRRAVLSVTRYLLRTTGRPTPFGLHAGVAPVWPGSPARVRVGSNPGKHVRPDAGWSAAVLLELLQVPGALEDVRVCANNLCEPRGDRLVLSYPRGGAQGVDNPGADRAPRAREVSVGLSPAVASAVRAARRPIGYSALRSRLLREFGEPHATSGVDPTDTATANSAPDDHPVTVVADPETVQAVDRLLSGLLEREILLLDEGDLARGIDPKQRIARATKDYQHTGLGAGIPAWHTLVDTLHARHYTERPPAQVDLRMDVDATLPTSLFAEAASVASVLWRLGPRGTGAPTLDRYHGEFLERYGTDRVVRVAEVLDPHRGLGPPAGYRNPPSERSTVPKPENLYPGWRDERLAELLWSRTGSELELDDDAVADLAGETGLADLAPESSESQENNPEHPPDSLDLCVALFSESAAALADGDYTMAITPGAGSLVAGAMAGRFTELLGIRTPLRDLLDRQQEERLYAQLFFRAATPRRENVMRMPQVLPYRVSVGCFDDPDDPAVIDPDRIAVGSTGQRLYLTVPDLGRELCVVAPHMLNQVTDAPNLARFLNAVSLGGVRPFAPWNWGRLAALPRLPRVRYRRTILAPACWRPTPDLVRLARSPGRTDGAAGSFQVWRRALDEWRCHLGVPRVIHAGVLDNHLELDLENDLHQRILYDHLRRNDPSPVWEPPGEYGSLGITAGHHNELAIPLRSVRPRPAVPAMPAWQAYRKPHPGQPPRLRHHPGGNWMHLRLGMVADLQNRFLIGQLPSLLAELDDAIQRWFFLRYRDPEPHLRLRLGGDPDTLNGRALPILRRWADDAVAAGLLTGFDLGGYEPEVERYGGPDAMAAAEEVFCADSLAVLRQLQWRSDATEEAGPSDAPLTDELLVAMNHAEMLATLDPSGNWDWRQWVLDSYPPELEHAIPAAERAAGAKALRMPPKAVRECWSPRASAILEYGNAIGVGTDRPHHPGISAILHMHANRLLGTDRAAERHAYGLLRAGARRQLEERRHHRDRHQDRDQERDRDRGRDRGRDA